ncbi:uncharacterized protein N7458_005921 [Penicillium daleae]|uniref:Uncharacterized protein n=1 Tax=Penicillium daleae TaxID=63821 RepID=A0AAD6G189_9EURO|nr:uncharacterized protein N7458_005921 [Penicillium daleae]KAJ5449472.1 hypothetical protein N7458_005921 [Penicillium daleae]
MACSTSVGLPSSAVRISIRRIGNEPELPEAGIRVTRTLSCKLFGETGLSSTAECGVSSSGGFVDAVLDSATVASAVASAGVLEIENDRIFCQKPASPIHPPLFAFSADFAGVTEAACWSAGANEGATTGPISRSLA